MGDVLSALRDGERDIVEHTRECLGKAKELNENYHHFTTICEERALRQAKRLKENLDEAKKMPLFGYMISIKDAICVKGVESAAGSRILEGYEPLFDATVIRKIEDAGGVIIGKTSQDEFGFGTFGVNVGLGKEVALNPLDKERSCGGSSSGAGGFSKLAPFPHIAVGESTGGSIANPASFCGVYGLTPTYGRASRYGLLDYGNSLDKIGALGKSAEEVARLLQVMSGHDEKDSTSSIESIPDFCADLGNVKGLKIGLIKESLSEGVEGDVRSALEKARSTLEEAGAIVEEVSLTFPSKYSLSAYYVLAMSEASTNLAKYCGMRYGQSAKLEGTFNEYFSSVRQEHLTREAKRRIIMGTFARMSGQRDAFYLKAASVRTKIIEAYKDAFESYDVLLSLSTPTVSPRFADIEKMEPLQHYLMDQLSVGPNLAGLPHLSVPIENEGKMPAGVLLICDHFKEQTLLKAGSVFGR